MNGFDNCIVSSIILKYGLLLVDVIGDVYAVRLLVLCRLQFGVVGFVHLEIVDPDIVAVSLRVFDCLALRLDCFEAARKVKQLLVVTV